MKDHAYCDVHKVHTCQAVATTLHIAGFECKPFSSMGQRNGLSSKSTRNFAAWASLSLFLGHKIIIVENAKQFRKYVESGLCKLFEKDYMIAHTLMDPRLVGQVVRRERFFGVLVHLSLFVVPARATDLTFDLERIVRIFFRLSSVSFHHLLKDTGVVELLDELLWMRGRKQSRANRMRLSDIIQQEPFHKCLTENEAHYWDNYILNDPVSGICHNLGQDPTKPAPDRGISSSKWAMHTICKKTALYLVNYGSMPHGILTDGCTNNLLPIARSFEECRRRPLLPSLSAADSLKTTASSMFMPYHGM